MTIFSFYRVVHIESFSKKIEKQKKKTKIKNRLLIESKKQYSQNSAEYI